MKKILLLVLIATSNIYSMAQESLESEIPAYGDSITMEGKFVKHQFYNKIGKPIEGIYDLFFKVSENQEFFIKKMECKFPKGELKDNLNKLFVIVASKNSGLWDADDNTVQSRVGDYIIVHEIKNK